MRSTTRLFIITVALSSAFPALAEPDNPHRKKGQGPILRLKPVGPTTPAPPPPPPPVPPPVAPPPPDNTALCAAKRSIMAQDQDRLDDLRTQLAGIDSEAAQLKRRLEELNRQRGPVRGQMGQIESRIKKQSSTYQADCAQAETCGQYETLARQLDQQGTAIQAQLTTTRTQIDTYRQTIKSLDAQIQPLRTEYASLQCNNMVPGSTAQQTIDRCAWIFSEWNRQQAHLNNMNGSLPQMKRQYEEYLSQLRAIEARASGYDTYMSRNCQTSPQYQVVQSYGQGGVRKRAETLGAELDSLIQDVVRLKGVQITLSTK
ncbi:MAG: hypothetical protein HYV07_13370 [Deltaproteobacteria bacterium]|nr:hypothetical protein [Deltaproteobacteria bacterium]